MVDYCCSYWLKVCISAWIVQAFYSFNDFLILDDLFWSSKVESDNDKLKEEVLPKREKLVESESRLSEKTNDLNEVNITIIPLFISSRSGRCYFVDWLFVFLELVFTGSRILWSKQLNSTPWSVFTALIVMKRDYRELHLMLSRLY